VPPQAQVDAEVAQLSNVGKLVHLAYRRDSVYESQLAALLFKQARQNYEAELTRQAAAVGCTRKGLLSEGQNLSLLKQYANESASSIVRTYNFDLAKAIQAIRAENPRANRNYYVKQLAGWETRRASWKDKQISLMTVSTSVQAAKEAFVQNNVLEGYATMEPRSAVEEECKSIIARGKLPLEFIAVTPCPIHINCPHTYETHYKKIPKIQCADLWLGA